MNIGEPDFTARPWCKKPPSAPLAPGSRQYPGLGLDALREAISGWYASRFGLQVPAGRIVITAGASAALQLACLALLDTGDEVLMPDPSYPATAISSRLHQAEPGAAAHHRRRTLSTERRTKWPPRGMNARGRAAGLALQPTGTSIASDELRRIHQVVQAHEGVTIVDEIYLGLSYDSAFGQSALALGEDIISINSFSKYFNMTGWRLGWMVVPEALVPRH